jgi:glycosyltransferase involved in cell wall biosynthesis
MSKKGLRSVHVVAISENVRRSARRFTDGSVDPFVIVPAIADHHFATPPKLTPAGGSIVAGFVGHHKPEKGLDLALDGMRAALNSGVDISLCALVSGAESRGASGQDAIRRMVEERHLRDRVRLIPGIQSTADFYSQIDLLLVPFRGTRGPSDYPMVLLEAMSCGVPTVCTPVGAMPELVVDGHNGFISRDASTAAYSDAMICASTIIRLRQMDIVENARTSAQAFRASRIASETLSYLQQIMDKN